MRQRLRVDDNERYGENPATVPVRRKILRNFAIVEILLRFRQAFEAQGKVNLFESVSCNGVSFIGS